MQVALITLIVNFFTLHFHWPAFTAIDQTTSFTSYTHFA